ncbi:MAG: hypothetical protein NTZ05_19150 [Chloroflexi bacterium]|nr:hypothetical protein [Chloroflexota bacterium]
MFLDFERLPVAMGLLAVQSGLPDDEQDQLGLAEAERRRNAP